MRNFIILIYLSIIVFACEKQNQLTNEKELLNKIKSEFAPDKREAIFDVSFSKTDGILKLKGETNLPETKTALFSELDVSKYTIIDSLIVLPDEKNDSLCWGLINISVCNLRTNPAHKAEMASQALLGTPVRVLKKQTRWNLVQTPDKYISWGDSGALSLISERGLINWRNQKKMIFLPSFGIGLSPETGMPVTDLVAGSILQFIAKSGNKCLLAMPDGRLLEVAASDVEDFETWKNKGIPPVSEITNMAGSFMGRPYLWGGTSTKGIDCSGFIKMIYFLNGIILARDASLQFRHGEKITQEQGWQKLKEGDLVFFRAKGRQSKT